MINSVLRLAFLGLCALLLATAPAGASMQTFPLLFTGDQVAPTTGHLAADGFGSITVFDNEIHYYIDLAQVSGATAARLYSGGWGQGGTMLLDLQPQFAMVDGRWVARGVVPGGQVLVNDLIALPESLFVQVDTADYPSGAVRSQLLANRVDNRLNVVTLSGSALMPMVGDADGMGTAVLWRDVTQLRYSVVVRNVDLPTNARLFVGDVGVNGPFALNLQPQWVELSDTESEAPTYVATGVVDLDACEDLLLANDLQNLNLVVDTSMFPNGAMRGQIRPGLTERFLPVAVADRGVGTTQWRSNLRVVNPFPTSTTLTLDFFPSSDAALQGPTRSATVVVAPSGQLLIDDLLTDQFGVSGSGALRLRSPLPLNISSRIFNIGSMNGTYGQSLPVLPLDGNLRAGTLVGLDNITTDQTFGFRTNLGMFNPAQVPATLQLTVRNRMGEQVAVRPITLEPFSHRQLAIHNLIPGMAADMSDFFVNYQVYTGDAFVYGSVVDNVTGDAVTVMPMPLQ